MSIHDLLTLKYQIENKGVGNMFECNLFDCFSKVSYRYAMLRI